MNIIDAGAANLLAGLQIDQLTKLRGGQMSLDQLERFNNLTAEEREERFGDWKRPKLAGAEGSASVKVCLKRLLLDDVIAFGDIKVTVHVLIKDATFEQMFSGLGEKRRCWKNKEEALAFAKQNKEKLGPNGNFFELESGFVAYVYLAYRGQPCVSSVDPLSYDGTWDAEYQHRVFSFSPQQ